MKNIIKLCAIIGLFTFVDTSYSQTVGLLYNDTSNSFKGYTLLASKHNSMSYLIDNNGHQVHEWTASNYPPGQAVYLLPNGNLFRTCQVQGQLGTGGGEGGRIEEYNWNDSLVWSIDYSTTTYMQHHDAKKLPNGNVIMCVVEKKTIAQAIAAGFDTSRFQPDVRTHGFFLPDAIIEVQPTYPSGGTVVWSWHVMDHLIQHFDSTKSNYGVPSAHPELIDAAGNHQAEPLFWNHVNSIDYNADLDQIVLSARGNSEIWVIDHSTTLAQSASHAGGAHGKGGDLLYRWGNPVCYGAGTIANEKLYQQHDAEWIKTGYPGAGHIMCFNNGLGRNYSTMDEIATPVDAFGNYSLTVGQPYAPTALFWTYQATPPSSLFALDISGAQRLPNGNTLIDNGPRGTLTEVTASGTTVWKYISPITNNGPLTQGDTLPADPTHANEFMNAIFRVYRYPLNFSAFTGRVITPGNTIELHPTSLSNIANQTDILENYPNPFTSRINIKNASGKENYELWNDIGILVWQGKNIELQDFSSLATGIYFLKTLTPSSIQILKAIKHNK